MAEFVPHCVLFLFVLHLVVVAVGIAIRMFILGIEFGERIQLNVHFLVLRVSKLGAKL